MSRPSRTLPVVASVLFLAIGAVVVRGSSGSGPGPGEAFVEVSGVAEVRRAGGGTETVTDHTRLEPGDALVVRSGSADLELSDAVHLGAVDASGEVGATEILMARVPTLRAGPVLVDAPDGTTIRSGAGEVRLAAGSTARVTRTAAARVDVLRGRAVLGSAGAEQAVTALRSAEVVAPGELTATRPVSYTASDAWDRRYLGAALSLDRELAPLLAGLRAEGVDGRALAEQVRRGVTGRPSADELRRLLARRTSPLDAAAGVAVVGAGHGGSFPARWARAIRFHDAGAPWGLVAMDLGARPDAVIDALSAALGTDGASGGSLSELAAGAIDPATGLPVVGALGDGGAVVDGGTGETDPSGSDPAGGTGSTTPGGSTGTTAPVTVPGPGLPPVTLPPVTIPPVTSPTIPVVTTIVDTLDGATGGTVTDLTDTLGGVLSPVTGPVTGTGGVLGPVTGGGGVLGGVTGPGGLLPLGP